MFTHNSQVVQLWPPSPSPAAAPRQTSVINSSAPSYFVISATSICSAVWEELNHTLSLSFSSSSYNYYLIILRWFLCAVDINLWIFGYFDKLFAIKLKTNTDILMVHWSMKEFNYAMSERVKISSENKVSLCQYDAR